MIRVTLAKSAAAAAIVLLAVGEVRAQEVQRVMGQPLDGLSASELSRWELGEVDFDRIFSAAEGLGPVFNDNSCGTCHSQPRSGGASAQRVTRFGLKANGSNPFDPLDNLGGSLLQVQGISPTCTEVVPPIADVTAFRITPHTFGSGLVEAIPDADILANAQNPPSNHVSGIARIVAPLEGGPARVGRFGWKAQVATLLTFSGDAGLNEMGITNALVPTENAPNGDLVLLAQCDQVADPEDVAPVGQRVIDRWTDFQRFLAPPPQMPRSGMTGESIFNAIGCADCHVSTFTTGAAVETAIANKTIKPYSDFLLHDMGSLGDGIVDGIATEKEMKTAALWGLADRETLLHDGRATGGTFEDNVTTAILEHAGEAQHARDGFANLSPADKALVIQFLQSLGRTEFDFEGDHDVDDLDWFFAKPFFTGPGNFIDADDPGAIGDSDADGDFDLEDFGRFQRGFTGQLI